MDNIYEKAAIGKYRFAYRGMLQVEDLYDLDLEQLNQIYMDLKKKAGITEDSLIETAKIDEELEIKIAIVKDIFTKKVEAAKQTELAADKKARKQKLLSILADKQDAELLAKSPEEIQKMIDEL